MRKKFDDLTREDILGLSDEDIKYYTDYKLAEEGIILPPHPGERPEKGDFPEPTEKVYECRGVIVTSLEEAKLLATLETVVETNYDDDYNYKYVQPASNYRSGIETNMYYKRDVLKLFKEDLKKNKKEIAAYDADLRDYNKAIEGSEAITSYITDIISSVYREKDFIESAQKRYTELLELAQDNKEIAFNFFAKAFPEDRTTEKLGDFFRDNDTYTIKAMNYQDFLDAVGVEHTKGEE